jgi:hypothetical protein
MDMMGYGGYYEDEGVSGDELDSYELDGDVMGMSLVGDDVLGAAKAIVRAAAQQRAPMRAPVRRPAPKPRWRNQLAPGVPVPDYGVFPVPLTPQTNNGTFTAAIANIEYRAVAQVPFRGERLITRVTRVGTSAAGAQVFATNGVHIGIRPQVGVLGPMNLEDYTANAFGVRLVMQQATQGAEVRVFAFISPALAGTDTLTLSIQILGRVAR